MLNLKERQKNSLCKTDEDHLNSTKHSMLVCTFYQMIIFIIMDLSNIIEYITSQ